MPDNREILLEVNNLSVTFGKKRNPFKAVDDVSFHIYKGETFGLVGESGSGKTTIGRAIIRINPTSGGDVLFHGEKINGPISRAKDREVTRKIQMIFQDPMASLNERAKVDYIVSEGLYSNGSHLSDAERREKVAKALSDVGLLPEFADRFPHEFSGGQRQRIGIARALVMEPEFIIADEPISALDVSTASQILKLITSLKEAMKIAFILICHDLNAIRQVASRVIVMYLGRIMEEAEVKDIFENPRHPYTRALLSSAPSADFKKRWKTPLILDKDISSIWEETQGCPFYSRCPDRMNHCRNHIPQMRKTDPSHSYACFI